MPNDLERWLEQQGACGRAEDSIEAQRVRLNVRARLLDETIPETRIDRYVVARRIGVGGMGVVYAALDPELGREVAIKLVRGSTDAVDQQRLLSEGRALAQLSHPNVVGIFAVGMHRDRVFIAMELVRGKTLRQWCATEHTWEAIVEVHLQAALGLAAAHHAGLVHRDFKPDNALVDTSGRVRVVDFGLARDDHPDAAAEGSTTSGKGSTTPGLTAKGGIVGTPAYMAPEQLLGSLADARSDQFAFCIALWEALYRERPCDGEAAASRSRDPAAWRPRTPRHPERAPAWLRDVLARGLAFDPDRRWPAMDALVAACRHPPRSRRRWLAALGLAATLVGGVLGMQAWHRARDRSICEKGARGVVSTWNATTTATVTAAFTRTGLTHAEATAAKVGPRLEAFATDLAATQRQACLAYRIAGELHETEWSRREACVQEHRERLDTVRELFETPDREIVNGAVRIAFTMPPTDRCEDDARLAATAAVLGTKTTSAAVDALRRRLARAQQLAISGRHADALAQADAGVAEAATLGDPVLEAEAQIAAASARAAAGDYADAVMHYERSYFVAAPLGVDDVALTAAIELTLLVGVRLARPDEGLAWARHAEAVLSRMSGSRDRHAAQLAEAKAALLRSQGDVEAAVTAYELAIDLRIAHAGASHPSVATTMLELAALESDSLHFAAAVSLLDDAEEILAAAHGDDALVLAPVHSTRCTIEFRQGRFAAALPHCERALAIREARLEPDHPALGTALFHISSVLAAVDEIARSREALARAIEIRRARLGPHHPQLAQALSNLGMNDLHAGDFDASERHLGEALQIRVATLPRGHNEITTTLINFGDLAIAREHWTDAKQRCEEAVTMVEPGGGDDDEAEHIRGRALMCLGIARFELGDLRGAAQALDEALLTSFADVGDPASRCEVRLVLARVLRKGDKERARALASEARPSCVEAGARASGILDELDAIARGE